MRKIIDLSLVLIVMMAVVPTVGAYYNPQAGRFIQRDPSGYVDGLNLYEYAKSSPVKYQDYTGKRIMMEREERDGYTGVLKVTATIAVVRGDCPSVPENVDQLVKNNIERVWTTDVVYYERIQVPDGNGWAIEIVKRKARVETSVGSIQVVDKASDVNPDYHVFYLVDKVTTPTDRSHAEMGGFRSEIYRDRTGTGRTYSHEYGHWLGLDDVYIESQLPGGNVKIGYEKEDIMAYGESVFIWALRTTWGAYQGGKINIGLPNSR